MSTDDLYLQTALRLQRWRDLAAHVTAYVLMNVVFMIAWAVNGDSYFWPAWTILGWGLGLSFQHFHVVIRGFITDGEVRRTMQSANVPPLRGSDHVHIS